MFKLDDNLLRELGLGELPTGEKNTMLRHIYETLEMRVGMKLAEQMSNEQLDEFESFIDKNDEAGALKWLETNFPNYKDVVASELENLKNEIKASSAQILEASHQASANQLDHQQPVDPNTPAQ
jgi:predicted RNA-binding Zn ribbon-like protein